MLSGEEAKIQRTKNRQRLACSMFGVIIILGLLFCVGILSLSAEKPTVSEIEKRELAPMPEFSFENLIKGTYIKELEAHYADTFPFREFFVNFGGIISENRGIRFDDVRIHENKPSETQPSEMTDNNQESLSPESNVDTNQENNSPPPIDNNAVGERRESTFIYKGKGLPIFGGSMKMGELYANTINKYHEALGDSVQIYDLVIPSSIELYLPDKYKNITTPEKPNIDNIYSHLAPGVKSVDAYTAMLNHRDEYIYFNTDHHWTGRGAYYAYTAFAKTAGFEPLKLEDYETKRIDNFLGSLYTQTQDSTLKDNIDFVEYYKMPVENKAWRILKNQPYSLYETTVHGEYAKGVNGYSVFLHGDFPLVKIQTENKNGKKIMVVKESFGNAFAPFLIPHYEEVYVVDERYYQLSSINLVKENGINEIIFVNNIFAANTTYHINNIERMMYQVFVPVTETTVPETEEEPEEETTKKKKRPITAPPNTTSEDVYYE